MDAIWYIEALGKPDGPMTAKEAIERMGFSDDPINVQAWTATMKDWDAAKNTDLKFYMPTSWLQSEVSKLESKSVAPAAPKALPVKSSPILVAEGYAKKKSRSVITTGVALLFIPYIGWVAGIFTIIAGFGIAKDRFVTAKCPHCKTQLIIGEKAKSPFQKCGGCGHKLEWRADGLFDLT